MISPSLRLEVLDHIFSKLLLKHKVFKNHEKVVKYLTRKLETHIHLPEGYIIQQGDDAEFMYFIAKGNCKVYVKDHYEEEQEVETTIDPGDFFGEIALLSKGKRTATVKSENYCTIGQID
jgi:CPA1 family monovalent cation:H+ antiporter